MITWRCPICGAINSKPSRFLKAAAHGKSADQVGAARCRACHAKASSRLLLAGAYDVVPSETASAQASVDRRGVDLSRSLRAALVKRRRPPAPSTPPTGMEHPTRAQSSSDEMATRALRPQKPRPDRPPAAVALLNFTGLGLGYLYAGRWGRWSLNVLGGAAILAAAWMLTSLTTRWVWIATWTAWSLCTGVEGWRSAGGGTRVTRQTMEPVIHTRRALAVLLVFASAFVAYSLLGTRERDLGLHAYQDADCGPALGHLARLGSTYKLALIPQPQQVEGALHECADFLRADTAAANGDFDLAVQEYERYRAEHPASVLGPMLLEKTAAAYLDWAGALQQRGAFEPAVEKCRTVIEAFSSTRAAADAPSVLTDIFMTWAQSLREQQQSEEALEVYAALQGLEGKSVTDQVISAAITETYFEWASDLRSDNRYNLALEMYDALEAGEGGSASPGDLRNSRADTYAEWALYLAGQHSVDEALEKCEMLMDAYPGTQAAADPAALKGRVYVESALAFIQDGQYSDALKELEKAEEETSDAEVIREIGAARESAARALATDTGPQGAELLEAALQNACLGEGVDSPAFGVLSETGRVLYDEELFSLSPDLIATIPGHLKYVICVDASQRETQHCGLYRPGSAKLTLHLIQISWQAWAIEPATGVSKHTRVFMGQSPGNCPRSWTAETGGDISVVAEPPAATDVINWIRGLLD